MLLMINMEHYMKFRVSEWVRVSINQIIIIKKIIEIDLLLKCLLIDKPRYILSIMTSIKIVVVLIVAVIY